MYILSERNVNTDISVLDRAWAGRETFAFIPERNSVSEEWINAAMASFPGAFQRDHFILLTSGSTGMPKLVIGEKSRAEKLVRVLHEIQDSEAARQTLLMLPLSYCFAFVNQWLWSRVMEREIVCTEGFKKADELERRLSGTKDCLLCLIGAQMLFFQKYFKEDASFPGVIRVHFAGGMFPQQQMGLVKKLFPKARIFNNYGCSEAMPRLTVRKLEESDDGRNIGAPLPGVEIRTGEKGEMLFRSPYRAVAFFDDVHGLRIPDESDWVPTGDLGEPLENGSWRISGRDNEVFKRFGEKISLLRLLETVSESWSGQAVFYRETDSLGEDAHVLVLAPAATDSEVRAILRAFRAGYPRTHWPIRVESVPVFPLLPNGKIDRAGLSRAIDKTVLWSQNI